MNKKPRKEMVQSYGILIEYRRALEHGDYEKAERIVQANPQVAQESFAKVSNEVLGVEAENDY